MKNIYLIKSDSYRLIDSVIKGIVKEKTNITTFSLDNTSIYDVIDDASYFGLFDTNRFIIIKNVKYFGGKFNYEEESNAIKSFVEKLDDKITLIFVCDNILKTKDLTKFMINNGAEIIDKSSVNEEDIANYINEYTTINKIKLNASSLNMILKNADNNIDIALMEIDKLSNISNNITEEVVDSYGSTIKSDNTFEFVDSVVQRKFDKCFLLLDELLENNTEVLGLISLLANRYSTIYIVKSADQDRIEDDKLAELLGFKNKGRLYYIRKDAKFYTLDQLKSIIIGLCDLDKKIKTGYNPVYGLKEFLLNL